MSSLIATEVKTNMCFSFNSTVFTIRTTYVPLMQAYNNNYNYNSLSDTTIRYSAYNLFVSADLYSLDSHSLRTRNLSSHNAVRITSQSIDCSVLLQSNIFSLTNVPEMESQPRPFVYVHSHACIALMLIVVGLDVRCIYQCFSASV